MQLLTINALFNNPVPVLPSHYAAVRVDWQTQGQPAQTITEDIAYLRCVEVDDNYNRVRDVQTLPNTADPGYPTNPTTVVQLTTYQRI